MKESQDRINCPNCENEYSSKFNYCPYCSQKNIDTDPKLKYFFSELLSANFNLDSKIFITLKSLVLKPAELSKEFLAGKREKYITPIRLYLIISLVYFFVVSLDFDNKSQIIEIGNSETVATDSSSVSIILDEVNTDSLTEFEEGIYQKIKVLNTPSGQKIFVEKMKKNISVGMFIFIPLTALLLLILFRKKTKYYIPNLIFTIHLQSLLFLWFTFFIIIGFFTDSGILFIIELFFVLFISFMWIKSFYETSSAKTILKMFLFSIVWSFLLIAFMGIVLVFSFWFLD